MCWESMMKLKGWAAAAQSKGRHKQRIWLRLSTSGVRIIDERTGHVEHEHHIQEVTYVMKDRSDPRAFAYVFSHPKGYKLMFIKTANMTSPSSDLSSLFLNENPSPIMGEQQSLDQSLGIVQTDSNAQKILTQPAVITVSLGETAMLGCNIMKDESYAVIWIKQVLGSPPQHIFYFYHSYSTPQGYGTSFSSSRFTSEAKSSKIDYQLIIRNVEASDSAVYYCYTWDSSVSSGVSQ
ncbi:DAB2 protein, partial [Polypterus senegalus]